MNKTLIIGLLLAFGSAPVLAAECEKMADEKKLAGAARTSYTKKCEKDAAAMASPAMASPACEKSAADKKLAGAAKTSHLKKCTADEAGKK